MFQILNQKNFKAYATFLQLTIHKENLTPDLKILQLKSH